MQKPAANQADTSHESGFKQMSQAADALSSGQPTQEFAGRGSGQETESLKEARIDNDRIAEFAGDRVSDLKQMLIDEVRARPLRALGWAAAVGAFFGMIAAK